MHLPASSRSPVVSTLLPYSRFATVAASNSSCPGCGPAPPGTRFVAIAGTDGSGLPYYSAPCAAPPAQPAGTLKSCDLVNFRGRRVPSSCGEGVCYAEMERTWTNGKPCPQCYDGVNVTETFWVADHSCGSNSPSTTTSNFDLLSNIETFTTCPTYGEGLQPVNKVWLACMHQQCVPHTFPASQAGETKGLTTLAIPTHE